MKGKGRVGQSFVSRKTTTLGFQQLQRSRGHRLCTACFTGSHGSSRGAVGGEQLGCCWAGWIPKLILPYRCPSWPCTSPFNDAAGMIRAGAGLAVQITCIQDARTWRNRMTQKPLAVLPMMHHIGWHSRLGNHPSQTASSWSRPHVNARAGCIAIQSQCKSWWLYRGTHGCLTSPTRCRLRSG